MTTRDESFCLHKEIIPSVNANYVKASIIWFNVMLGASFGYAVLLPEIKRMHNISNSVIGLVLLTSVLSAIIGAPLAAWIVKYKGSHICTFLGMLVLLIFYPFLGYHGPLWILFISNVGIGIGLASTDIGDSHQGVTFEICYKTAALGFFTSCFALGGLIGALSAGGISYSSVSLVVKFAGFSVFAIIPSCIFYLFLLDQSIQNRTSQYKSISSQGSMVSHHNISLSIRDNASFREANDVFSDSLDDTSEPGFLSNTIDQHYIPSQPIKSIAKIDNRPTSSKRYICSLILIGMLGYMVN
jgi:MFS family permease